MLGFATDWVEPIICKAGTFPFFPKVSCRFSLSPGNLSSSVREARRLVLEEDLRITLVSGSSPSPHPPPSAVLDFVGKSVFGLDSIKLILAYRISFHQRGFT